MGAERTLVLLGLRPRFHPPPQNLNRDIIFRRVCLPGRLVLATVQAAYLDASPATESPKGRQDATG